MNDILNYDYRKEVNEFIPLLEDIKETSESNISMHIIEPILINVLNYKKEWLTKEKRSDNSRKHFDILITDNKRNKILIECKKASIKLNNEHLEQLTNYMNSQNIEWGILTNGYEWILVNNLFKDIKHIADRILFEVDIRSRNMMKTPNNMKYYTYESLFCNNGIINYVKLIIQYNICKRHNMSSWPNYKCALLKFSEYLMEENNFLYVEMDRIQNYQFIQFYRWYVQQETHKKKNKSSKNIKLKPTTVKNLYRYINNFYLTLFEQGYFKINPFSSMDLNIVMNELDDVIDWSTNKELSLQDISIIVEKTYELLKGTRDAERNMVVFLLFIYGLNRKEIVALKNQDICDDYINIRGEKFQRKIPMSNNLREQIKIYMQYKKKKKLKNEKFICTSNGKKINAQSLSEVINEKVKLINYNINIEKIQQFIYKEYVNKGKDIFSILYLTNLDVSNLKRFITNEDIKKMGRPEKLLNKHPFRDML